MRKRDNIKYAAIFKALSNENRLLVFDLIRKGRSSRAKCDVPDLPDTVPEGAVCVCEILEHLDVTPPTLSHHLKELRNAGLVDVFNSGRWSYYAVKPNVQENLVGFFGGHPPVSKTCKK